LGHCNDCFIAGDCVALQPVAGGIIVKLNEREIAHDARVAKDGRQSDLIAHQDIPRDGGRGDANLRDRDLAQGSSHKNKEEAEGGEPMAVWAARHDFFWYSRLSALSLLQALDSKA